MPDIQSILHPAGIQAARVAHLWWVDVLDLRCRLGRVAIAALVAIRRGARGRPRRRPIRRWRARCAIAGGISGVLVMGLLFQSVVTGRALDTLRTPQALRIQVTGNQWWWDVQYDEPDPLSARHDRQRDSHSCGTARRFDLLSNDVIHSFWIPNLQGKIDLVPGRMNEIWLQADRPGMYRGQCAEYCGVQHAKMAFVVVADPPDVFERWLAANRAPAPAPATTRTGTRPDVIERGPCAMCHTIAGTSAGGRTAPDLTHIASRSTLGAGSIPNTREHLAGWIADPSGSNRAAGCRRRR